MSKKQEVKVEELESVGRALSKSEAFIEKNQKPIFIGVGVVVLIVLAIMAFHNFYQKPREIAAENAMYKAQEFFAVDSFRVALEGDGTQIMGFKEIASEYGYDCRDLSSEVLASLLASQNSREEFSELQNKIEDFFEEIKNELEELVLEEDE